MKKNIYVPIFAILCFTLLATKIFSQQNIAPQDLFKLTPQERILFTAPYTTTWTAGRAQQSLRAFWEAFNSDLPPVPLNANSEELGWYDLDAGGSQNHGLLWMGESVLGNALAGNVTDYEIAAQRCILLISLDKQQGHMRKEAIGSYIGFWEGSIAAMALGGMYAPVGSTSGPQLLAAAREWWADHIAVLRRLAMPDGQLGLVGSRMFSGDDAGGNDTWMCLSAAVNLQLIDPRPHNTLHPYIAALISADGQPLPGKSNSSCDWMTHRAVAERWVVLRAFQAGAILRVPANQPSPLVIQNIFRWTAGNRINIATPQVTGYKRSRWKASWAPGEWIRVDVVDPSGTPNSGFGPWSPPSPLNIPANAVQILGPVFTTAKDACVQTNNCGNDASVLSIVQPYHNGCLTTLNPKVVIRNEGTVAMTELALYYQIDNNTLYSQYNQGAVKSKRFAVTSGPGLLPDSTILLTLDASTVTAGTHTLTVWVMDVNKITDVNATNNVQTIQFEVVNAGKPTTYSENFESITPGNIPADWTFYNPDATGNWFVHATATNRAAALNNYGYTGANNAKDELVMPVVDITGNTALWLSFDLCHASKPNSTKFDSLQVMLSTDCGQTFTSIWNRGGTALNTVPDNANLFIPAGPQDYQNIKIDLSAYVSNGKAIFKFVNWSNNNNSTLIDNVNFTTSAVTGAEEFQVSESMLQVFPNPASESIQITTELKNSAELKIQLINSLGQTVNQVNYGPDRYREQQGYHVSRVDVRNYPSGIYNLVIISDENQVMTKKIVISR